MLIKILQRSINDKFYNLDTSVTSKIFNIVKETPRFLNKLAAFLYIEFELQKTGDLLLSAVGRYNFKAAHFKWYAFFVEDSHRPDPSPLRFNIFA